MKLVLPLAAIGLYLLTACTMFSTWRSIPAPGGCDECHQVAISANWRVSYKPVTLTDERNQEAFQKPESVLQSNKKPASSLETQKLEQLPCFDCHNSPDAAHKAMKGKFHH